VSNEVCTVIFVISGSDKKYTNYVVSIHQYFIPPFISKIPQYIHNSDEILSGDNRVKEKLYPKQVSNIAIKIDEIVATSGIRKLKPRQRKCYYPDEADGSFYQNYTVNLCKMKCRVENSLKFCGCVPFFYATKIVMEKS
jgi:amiloride-sensitive sodium channel